MLQVSTAMRVPVPPSEDAVRHMQRTLARWAPVLRLPFRRWLRGVEIDGLEHLRGPCLLMMNHGCPPDPLVVGLHTAVPIQWLVTAPAMQVRYARSRMLAYWGQIPKHKLEPDTRAIRTMKAWAQAGAVVGVFPEGVFPWDGEAQPMMPGLTQLVRYLDLPVVTMRIHNADRLQPAWARHPRRTTVALEIDPPRTFARGEDIPTAIASALRVDPATARRWPVSGRRLAAGLGALLAYCPTCGAPRLDDSGDRLSCSGCGTRWEVGTDNRLRGPEELSITEALRRIRERVASDWGPSGPALKSIGTVEVRDLTGDLEDTLASGPLELRDGVLRLPGWELPLDDVLLTTRDWPDRILLKTRRTRVGLDLPHDSRALWTWAIARARGEPCESAA
ncbi:MAG: 1-acyl-sn-glycerol-3-phosphate acyltransferase [Alphaproteobacteria bacterium]|nr:1-acyl-sn-glycerol-3-phosphate acyltransferase [Alphaproteobacteria bacterium]